MLPDVGASRSWEKAGVNHKARDIRTKPRAHQSPITPVPRISVVVIKKLKLLVTRTSRKTKGRRWNRFPTVKNTRETNANAYVTQAPPVATEPTEHVASISIQISSGTSEEHRGHGRTVPPRPVRSNKPCARPSSVNPKQSAVSLTLTLQAVYHMPQIKA